MAKINESQINLEALKGTKTEENLHTALSGESQAYLRYKWFEAKARDDGFIDISKIFCETAENEKEHAELWFRALGGWQDTASNLDSAAGGEHFEWKMMYAEFAEVARSEGFTYLADLFTRVADIEKTHEERYLTKLSELRNGTAFTREDETTKWICLNCGHIAEGREAPKVCPTCLAPQGYFKVKE